MLVRYSALFFCLATSVSALSADEPATRQPSIVELEQQIAATKDFSTQYRLYGKLLAADPQRIPVTLPPLLVRAGGLKAGDLYIRDLVQPCAKDAVPTLIKMLENENPEERQAWPAQMALTLIVDTARPALGEVLHKHKSLLTRTTAAEILGTDASTDKAKTIEILKPALSDADVNLRIQAAKSTLQLNPDATDGIEVLRKDFSAQKAEILKFIWQREPRETWRSLLLLGLDQKENRAWQAKSALKVVQLDRKWTAATHGAVSEGLFTSGAEMDGLALECATTLPKHPGFEPQSVEQLTQICDSPGDSLQLLAAASASLIRLDPEQTDLRLPAVLASLIRPSYSTSRTEYLLLIGSLGNKGGLAERPLLKLLQQETNRQRLLTAVVYLQLQPADPQPALDVLKDAVEGKLKNSGRVGFNQANLLCPRLESVFPDCLAALETEDAGRIRVATTLLKFSGSAAKSILPDLEKRAAANGVGAQDLKEIIKSLKAN